MSTLHTVITELKNKVAWPFHDDKRYCKRQFTNFAWGHKSVPSNDNNELMDNFLKLASEMRTMNFIWKIYNIDNEKFYFIFYYVIFILLKIVWLEPILFYLNNF